jgi:hypothetical protein
MTEGGRVLTLARASITMHMFRLSLLAAALFAAPAFARLPAPSEDAKAKAAEAAARTLWSTKVAAFQLCQAQDKAVADHHAAMKNTGRASVPVDTASAPCVDPGSFVAPISPAAPVSSSRR